VRIQCEWTLAHHSQALVPPFFCSSMESMMATFQCGPRLAITHQRNRDGSRQVSASPWQARDEQPSRAPCLHASADQRSQCAATPSRQKCGSLTATAPLPRNRRRFRRDSSNSPSRVNPTSSSRAVYSGSVRASSIAVGTDQRKAPAQRRPNNPIGAGRGRSSFMQRSSTNRTAALTCCRTRATRPTRVGFVPDPRPSASSMASRMRVPPG